ncbi:MAG: SIS domain-containing protein [Patescibacteria group bacterium]
MHVLDTEKTWERYDRDRMFESIQALGQQFQQAYEEASAVRIPKSYSKVKSVVICGMGGSALAGHVIQTVFRDVLRVPVAVINDYHWPAYVSTDTLCIISSYSGTTEEPVAALPEARRKHAKILIICAGGTMAKRAHQYRLPAYIFNPKHNPCDQPRMALGYSIIGMMMLLKNAGLLSVRAQTVQRMIREVQRAQKRYGLKLAFNSNIAKKTAQQLHGKIPVLVSSEHLIGNMHVFANQLNENSKTFAMYFPIPELNHHLLEGLRFPKLNTRALTFLFVTSKNFDKRNILRCAITQSVVVKNHIPTITIPIPRADRVVEACHALVFGSYVNYYLALLYRIDPSPIPWVHYFKKALAVGTKSR